MTMKNNAGRKVFNKIPGKVDKIKAGVKPLYHEES
jgi:hypothetical protein